MHIRCVLQTVVIGFVIVTACVGANEFIKKIPAREQRRQAQKRDLLVEQCITLFDQALHKVFKLQETSGSLWRSLYTQVSCKIKGESCDFDAADTQKLKQIVARLESLVTQLESLDANMGSLYTQVCSLGDTPPKK